MEKLFEKGYIGSCQIKNRVVMTAMTTGYAAEDGKPTEQLLRYYEARAKGGVGLIVTEIFRLNNEHGVAFPRQLYALNPNNIPALAQMTARVHQYGTKIFAQLHHGGSTNMPGLNKRIVAPSPIPNVTGIMPEEMTIEDINELKGQFVQTAVACKSADFDGVELHGAHGYLLCEFLSPASNQRTDRYGGSAENRCRIVTELIQEIKAACGKDFPVAVRFSALEYDPDHELSLKIEDGIEIAKILEAAGADALDVSCGNYFTKYGENEEPYSYAQGWRKENTRKVKEAVHVPVIGVNTIKTPEFAETLLEDGICDFIGLGRGSIADPEWTRKAQTGRSDEIYKCIGCIYCFESIMNVGYIRCSVNPRAGKEAVFHESLEKNGNHRKVAVVGGGPAGMMAANILAQREFDVTLFEKGGELGGDLLLAGATAPYKEKLVWIRDTLKAHLDKYGVNVVLNCEATPEIVKQYEPEAVFVAAGGSPVIPKMDGVDQANVCTAEEVIRGEKKVCGNTVIIGAGLTGLETAEMLFRQGCVEKITIADMVPQIGLGMYPSVFVDVMKEMAGQPLELLPGHMLKGIKPEGVTFTKLEDQSEVCLKADSVILSLGLKPRRETVSAFEKEFGRVIPLGEARRTPGRVATSMEDGYIMARGFDPEA